MQHNTPTEPRCTGGGSPAETGPMEARRVLALGSSRSMLGAVLTLMLAITAAVGCGDNKPPTVTPEAELSCTDGADDDNDGLVDCQDPDCAQDAACDTTTDPEVCDNGADDDGDGLIDCQDLECASAANCQTPDPEVCDDGADNDGDGAIDCLDSDCASAANCQTPDPEICDDGLDNDGDGDTDCDDAACAAAPECQPPPDEVCDDGIDNDEDGDTDCDDADCQDDPDCQPDPEVCDDGTDNDGDGAIDCGDDDCLDDPACEVTEDICDDGIDNDDDGDADCADDDCAEAANCQPQDEICNDGLDNDEDGDIDCADSDCDDAANCQPGAEICDDGVDNDEDGDTDCDDADCADFAACQAADDACANPLTLDGPGAYIGNTEGGSDLYTPSCQTTDSTEQAWVWTAPADGTICLDTNGSDFDTILTVFTECGNPDTEVDCDDDDGADGTRSQIEFEATEGTTYYVLVDGFNGQDGEYFLKVRAGACDEPAPEVCFDTWDNDGDDATDCDDDDCADSPFCQPEVCDDGIDNNQDGDIDCADEECVDFAACQEVCDSGEDEDLDGDIDCADSDCVDAPNCQEVCEGGIDEDLDGLTDCADDDCFGTPECPAADEICDDGTDNDQDGLTDCEDVDDCADDVACIPPLSCRDLGAIDAIEEPTTGNNTELADENRASCLGAAGVGGREAVFAYAVDETGFYCIDTNGSTYDTVLYVRTSDCADGDEVACNDDIGGGNTRSQIEVRLEAGVDYFVFVDGYSATSRGDYALNIRPGYCGDPAPEVCADGRDNDQDGQIDCEDADDCATAPNCVPEADACDDDFDNDDDGLTDCADDDCFGTPECPATDEVCDDGIDNDQDGTTDCGDADCVDFAACVEAGNCDDGIDNDGDGLTDCADTDECGAEAVCIEAGNCNDGIDNDLDGLTDCEDVDECGAETFCVDACLEPAEAGPGQFTGSNEGAGRFHTGSCVTGTAGAEQVFAWTAPADLTICLDTFGSTYDTVLYVRSADCADGEDVACDDDSAAVLQSQVEFEATEGETYFFFVDGFGSTSVGDFVLNVRAESCATPAPEACFDRVDNDGDGLTDCADIDDCAAAPNCNPEAICDDGEDDDLDGDIDCEDSDCVDAPACQEACEGGIDEDLDGLVDCLDPDCFGTVECPATDEVCDDGIDNDQDGTTDCDDDDCFDDPVCIAPLSCRDLGVIDAIDAPTTGNNSELANETRGSCGGNGREATYALQVDAAGFYCLDTRGSAYDTVLYVRTDCDDPESQVACNDDIAQGNTRSEIEVRMEAGVEYYVFVDAFSATGGSDYTLNIRPGYCGDPAPEVCDDGRDNDQDGLIDCEDADDCATAPNCVPEADACDDGFDNDDDGLTDCEDIDDCGANPACQEICDDGIDNDLDGIFDCNDPDCFATAECPASDEACDDGIDNDQDEAIDCEDADCAADPVCVEAGNCNDGIDNDLDGLTDCEDIDECADASNCIDACLDPAEAGPGQFTGSNEDASNFHTGSCVTSTTGAEQVFAWTAPADLTICLDTFGSTYDTVLYVRAADCADGEDVACDDDLSQGVLQSQVEFEATEGETYFFFVDGFGSTSVGDFVLNVRAESCDTPTPEVCDDRVDNDGNGSIDCADDACADFAACVEAGNCDDGIDNDGDGLTDCADIDDCGAEALCIEDGNCADGVDNDLNGLTDCADPICFGTPECPASDEVCNDGLDNDQDGAIDCDDDDCAADPACVPACDRAEEASPGTFTGDTTDARDDYSGSCGSDLSSGNEAVYVWTAPADLTVCLDTFGSEFDTILYIRGADCAEGEEIACDDDTDGRQSQLQVDVVEGETYHFFVDGFGATNNGEYVLNIAAGPCPRPEVCDDGIDNDLDGLTDCEDAEQCGDFAACVEAGNCDDGIDNDGNGDIDCDDAACAADPICAVGEVCDNGTDDDGDGLIDCEDDECIDFPACIEPASCQDPLEAGPGTFNGDTSGASNNHDPSCVNSNAPEHVYVWTAPADITVCLDTAGSTFDTALYVRTNCGDADSEITCNDDTPFPGTTSQLQLDAVEGETYFFFVDGFGGNSGEYTLNINAGPCPEPEVCDDGIDNDLDGLTDCDDTEQCATSAACTETGAECVDGTDNDGDGLIDCADDDCAANPLCLEAGNCDDGIDNDLNGDTDCEDAACAADPICAVGEVCDNGADDDGDGDVDCEDTECIDFPACIEPFSCQDPGMLDGPGTYTGDTTDASNNHRGSCNGAGVEHVWAWTAPADLTICANTEGTSFSDSVLYVRTECGDPASQVVCDDDGGSGLLSQLEFEAVAGETYFFFVDGFGANERGEYVLNIEDCTPQPEICDDGIDNDRDGDTDCADDDCALDFACFEICDDGVDNDADGLTDCADIDDCAFDPVCIPEVCDNLIDDNFNGLTDCDDPDCAGDPACGPEPFTCEAPGELMGPGTYTGNTTGASDNHDGSCQTNTTFEHVWAWTAPADLTICANTEGTSFSDSVLYVRTECGEPTSQVVCDDDGGSGLLSQLEFEAVAGETYFFFVDGFGNGSNFGEYVLNIEDCTPQPEICDDGIDNDGDTDTDCFDDECIGDPACVPQPEVCDDGIDNDFNGDIDCDDLACAGDPACIEPFTCEAPGELMGPGIYTGNTTGASNNHFGSCQDNTNSEHVWAWTAPADLTICADTRGSVMNDTVLYVRTACDDPAAEVVCNDDIGGGNFRSEVSFEAVAGETYFFFVDGFGGNNGEYTLNIEDCTPTPEICGDGIDNDGDGLTDCEDLLTCGADPSCIPEDCGNGIDDNGDGFIDCDDVTCFADLSCQPEVCDNGIDDNGNGLIDCGEPECDLEPACQGIANACGTPNPGIIGFFATQTANTAALPNRVGGSCGDALEPLNGNEAVWRFITTANRTVCVTVEDAAFDTVLSIRDRNSCFNEELACDSDFPVGLSQIEFTTPAERYFYVIAEGYNADAFGEITVSMTDGPCPIID